MGECHKSNQGFVIGRGTNPTIHYHCHNDDDDFIIIVIMMIMIICMVVMIMTIMMKYKTMQKIAGSCRARNLAANRQ